MNSFYQEIARQHQELLILPEKKLIHQFIDELFSILFSNTSKSYGILAIIENKFDGLEKQFDELVLDFAPKNQNSTILGGQTTVGRDSIIGGNVWLTYSVPSNSVVYHKNEMKVKDNNPFPEPIFYSI